jgi:hypothetical protein
MESRDSSVGIAMGQTDRVGSSPGQETFLFSVASTPVLGPTQPPIQWVPGDFSPVVKRLERKTENSSSSSAGVKKGGTITPLLHTF